MKSRIGSAATDIISHDNAHDLRKATAGLNTDGAAALNALGSMLNTINNKWSNNHERRAEIPTSLGFTALYDKAAYKDQQAIGELLSRAAKALVADGKALQG